MDNSRKKDDVSISEQISEHGRDARKFEERLKRIFVACGVEKDSELARILDIKPQSITAARKRQQIPSGWIENIAENNHILADWLFFGTGPMRRGEAAKEAPAPQASDAFLTAPQEEFRMSDMLTKTAEVLESDTIYRTALASNINAFHQAVRSERTLARLEERMAEWEAKADEMMKRMEELERENRELKRRLEPPRQNQAVGEAG
ncbi:helix-turn-helix domain-containing protein [Solidesulfovibrio sp. C21]|uniref:helix-turn-helix domain-containing protein n=1 Tax=Solidesulfovibrio sp. C21 TaxID=3398613 RepID=UPI0039FBDA4F